MRNLKILFSYLGAYRRDAILGVFFVSVETVLELFIPVIMANIIDVGRDTLTGAIFGDRSKTRALTDLLADFGILEIAKTGTLAIERGRSTIYDDNKLKEEYNYGKNVL